jgi:hypothetical protein
MTIETPAKTLFKNESYTRNRSKYLVLHCIKELESEGKPVTFINLYVNASVPFWTLSGGLAKWEKWRYLSIHKGENTATTYSLTTAGLHFLDKLEDIMPVITQGWLSEQDAWRKLVFPDLPTSWKRSELIEYLEGCRYHRPATHPGITGKRAEKPKRVLPQSKPYPEGTLALKAGPGWWIFTRPYGGWQDRHYTIQKPSGAMMFTDHTVLHNYLQNLGVNSLNTF